jgi:hypothetical protein
VYAVHTYLLGRSRRWLVVCCCCAIDHVKCSWWDSDIRSQRLGWSEGALPVLVCVGLVVGGALSWPCVPSCATRRGKSPGAATITPPEPPIIRGLHAARKVLADRYEEVTQPPSASLPRTPWLFDAFNQSPWMCLALCAVRWQENPKIPSHPTQFCPFSKASERDPRSRIKQNNVARLEPHSSARRSCLASSNVPRSAVDHGTLSSVTRFRKRLVFHLEAELDPPPWSVSGALVLGPLPRPLPTGRTLGGATGDC